MIKRQGEARLKTIEDVDRELTEIVKQLNNAKIMNDLVEVSDLNKINTADYPTPTFVAHKQGDGARLLYLIIGGKLKQLKVDGSGQVFI